MVNGRDPTRVNQIADELRALGATVEVALGDVAEPDGAARVAECARAFRPQILVNNAGPFAEHDWDTAAPDAWLETFRGNVLSIVRLTQALMPQMRESGWGRVINIGSRAATTPLPTMVDYSAAKAAVVNITTSLAQHLSGSGITANTVSPGVIVTDGMQRMFEQRAAQQGRQATWEELEQEVVDDYAPNPTKRLGRAQDIAHAVAFLASPLAGYINGIDLRVDGGLTKVP
jgi:NAD(P)-dependent dehydrogenase (short-subunit alcohol dehydrogenase family)